MAILAGIISQKGGVGKSTVCRLLAIEFARAGREVLIADMDTSQSTSYEWNSRRLEGRLEPVISVQQFAGVDRALKLINNYDLIAFDGAPHSTRVTRQIAKESNLVILPTGNSLEDLNPQIRLAHELTDNGVGKEKIVFVLSRIGSSDIETGEVVKYLKRTGFKTLEGDIPEKTAFRRAIREGKAVSETPFRTLNERAEKLAQSIVNRIN